jgi:hypothetical protein
MNCSWSNRTNRKNIGRICIEQIKEAGDRGTYSSLKPNRKSTFKNEQHSRRSNSTTLRNRRLILHIVNQPRLHHHHRRHNRNHREQKWSPSHPINQEPRNKTRHEKPRLQEPGHQRTQMIIKAQRCRKQRIGVVDQGIDAAELLERLDSTRNEEPSLALNRVVSEEIAPRACSQRSFVLACAENVAVESVDGLLRHVICVQTGENVERGGGLGMRCEPAGGFGDKRQEHQHREQKYALQNCRDAPGKRSAVGLCEAVIDPVGEEDAEVEGGELHANVWVWRG